MAFPMLILTREHKNYTFRLRRSMRDVTDAEYVVSDRVIHRNPPTGTIYDVELEDGRIVPLDEVMRAHEVEE